MNAVPIHFIYSLKIDDKIFNIKDVDKHWDAFQTGQQIWIFQTYCLLKQHYPDVTLGNTPRSDCINIVHAGNYGRTNRITDYYILSIRADYGSLLWSNFEIVQNKLQFKRKTAYITHWPQPGIKKRKNHSLTVENIAYFGNPEQNVLGSYPVESDLNAMGIKYVRKDRSNWNDYSDVDLVLAVRQIGQNNSADNKPPSKLINAWWAEVPLIASNDSAYSQIAVPGEDYITVNSYDEMLQKIKMLRDSPDYYNKIIKNGIRRRERYSRENIIKEWISVLENEVFPDFREWKRMSVMNKLLDRSSRWTLRQAQRVAVKAGDIAKLR
jgi:hypothetical protein